MADPAGETDGVALRLDFDRRVMLRFHGSAITSDGGLLAYRELDDVLALTASGGEGLEGGRTRKPSPLFRLSRPNGSTRCTSAVSRGSSCSIWIRAKARLTAHRKAAPTMGISAAPVIIRCLCSTSLAIWSGAPRARAACTAPPAGEKCWSRWSPATVAL